MKVVVDTNVFLSGVYFAGPPYEILDAWRHGKIEIVISAAILAEYQTAAERLSARYPAVDFATWIELVAMKATVVPAPNLPQKVCTDPDDDKFLACAVASGTKIIASGDKALLRASGYSGVEVIKPRHFLDKYLK